jgi:hypothetical protein
MPALRLAPRRPSRPSVVVDLSAGAPRFTSPLSLSEARAMRDRPPAVPHAVFTAMYVAAWARAEGCPLNIVAGRLEPSVRNEPSDDLWAATAQSMGQLVGSLGFAIPILRDPHGRAVAATWPAWWGGS